MLCVGLGVQCAALCVCVIDWMNFRCVLEISLSYKLYYTHYEDAKCWHSLVLNQTHWKLYCVVCLCLCLGRGVCSVFAYIFARRGGFVLCCLSSFFNRGGGLPGWETENQCGRHQGPAPPGGNLRQQHGEQWPLPWLTAGLHGRGGAGVVGPSVHTG